MKFIQKKQKDQKDMLSDNLSKIASLVLASKLTNKVLGMQLDALITKNNFQNKTWDLLNEQQKEEYNKIRKQAVEKIDKFFAQVSQVLKIQLTKDLITLVNNLIKSVGGNIYSDQNKEQFINTIKDYVTYQQFLNPQFQDITKITSLSDLYDQIGTYKKILAVKEQSIKDYTVAIRKGNYVVLQITDKDRQRFTKWFKGQANWCILGGMWNSHERPYFLVLDNYKPAWLINIPTRQWRNLQNGAIKVEQVNSDFIFILNEIMNKYYNGNYWYGKHYFGTDNIDVFVPYFPQDQIEKGIQNGRIAGDLLKRVVKNTFKTNDNKLIQNLINTFIKSGKDLNEFLPAISSENQYRTIMLKMFPKPKQEKEQAWLKSNVTLNINNLKQIIFNAFENGNNLFKRMLKFFPTQQNINEYREGQQYNPDLLNISYNGSTLTDVIANLKQLKLLNEVTEQATNKSISLNKEQGMKLFKNCCSKEIKDMPTIQFLLKNEIIQLNKQTLRMAIDTGSDAVNKLFIERADSNLLNEPLFDSMIPIFYSIKQKKYNVLDKLLESNKVKSDAVTTDGKDIIWYALTLAQNDVVKSIIQRVKNIDLNKVYAVGVCADNTLLTYYVNNGEKNMVDLLLSNNNVDVNLKSPIDIAIQKKDNGLIDKFINSTRFNQFYPNEDGDVPIVVAIKADNTFNLFEKFANKIGKSKLVSAQLTNKKTKETLLQVAIDNNIPFEILTKYFDSKNVSYATNKIYNLVLSKLAIRPNDENMLKIKQWMFEQNKSKTKTKKSKLQQQLKSLAYKNNEQAFKQLLQKHAEQFDFSKKVDGVNLIYLFASSAPNSKYLKLLLQFISKSSKYSGQLKGLLQQQFNYENAYDNAASVNKNILKPYYQKSNIKVSNKQFKKILAFVEKYIN